MRRPWIRHSETIRIFDDAALRAPARDVTEFGADLKRLIDRLFRVQKRDRAIGVAASQIGEPWNVFVLNGGEIERGGKPEAYVNARILSEFGESIGEEGCLSFPGIFVPVHRPNAVTISAKGIDGKPFEIEGRGLLARAFSHEIDHLQGRLIIDRVSPNVRDKILSRMKSKTRKPARES